MAAVVAAAVVALALITASVVYLTRGDSDSDSSADGKPSPSPSSSSSPEPSPTPTDEPSDEEATDYPDPDEPSEDPDESPSDVPLPSFLLRVGDCFDESEEREGAIIDRDCDESHDAEVVSRKKLTGDYSTDGAVRSKADSMCRTLLRDKAAKQPRGTVGGTLITYPKAENAGTALSYVTCSLTAGKGKQLSKPLV
ncbi:hypothetical protein [Streptomyces qinglanensis]|uniref:Septum formation-related domain-containing protein n=1 Tax=Streptomyces qinglanensis TaxID=943816 RepID=A0A1H9TZQ1_9ACTN|nr:hypothetical protein [Streptomyces qinglanensis]SES02666.1 hypothetical protein SAMN05421870_107162 [Streptomyces qinglanensis]